jgi:RHS repeat-associated protein
VVTPLTYSIQGSITHITNSSGSLVQELSYDAWGRLRNPVNQQAYAPGEEPELFLGRGYTGHEHLTMFGLINMNARLYDPALGRFLSPDPYVQAPDFSQSFNRYSYCLNNPLKYMDPNGEFIFSLFLGPVGIVLDGMCWGAVIGAGTGAVAYSIGAGISGNWSWNNFGKSVGMGAAGGAIAGGFGALGGIGALGSFGNTLGYNILGQTSSNLITSAVYGNDITWGSLAGSLVGGLVGSALPNFSAVEGGAFKNAIAEIGFNSLRGTTTGLFSGMTQAIIDKNPNAVWQNAIGGAISGASSSILNIAAFGPVYKPHDNYYSHDKSGQSAYRKGGLLLKDGQGLTWGRNLGVTGEGRDLVEVEAHESTHLWQQNKMGWANFYGKTIKSYISDFFKYGTINNLYYTHGSLEWQANKAADYYIKYIYPY